MPFTLAHPAFVLPLRRLGLPVSAMVIGSMVPDVPLFVRWPEAYRFSHSGEGVVTVNLVVTLMLLSAWNFFVRDALVDLAPGPVRERFTSRHRLGTRQWLWAPVAAALGSVTHLVWDAFTHRNRWGVTHVDLLGTHWGLLPGYEWAQYASGLAGLLVVLGAIVAHCRSREPDSATRPRVLPAPVLLLVVGAALAYGLISTVARVGDGLHAAAFHGVVQGVLALAAGISATCLVWWTFALLRRCYAA